MNDDTAKIARDVEWVLERHDIHLNTDDFNALYDFIEAIMTRIKENGT